MRHSGRRRAGFTLVELIVAMTLTVLVTGSTVVMLRSMTAARERLDRYVPLQHEGRVAVEAVTTALRNAYRAEAKESPLEGIDEVQGGWPADRIRFFTVSLRPVRPGQPESEVHECEFFLQMRGPDELPSLMCRRDPTRNALPDGGGVVQRVAAGVVGLDFRYLDRGKWVDDWTEERQAWPEAVDVRVVVMSPRPPRQTSSLARIVNIPGRARPASPDEEGKANE
jgi:prepilin-type N-terminal cleavage/methylation domain-containing protein